MPTDSGVARAWSDTTSELASSEIGEMVMRELKKQQLVGDAILPFYQNRLKIEEIIRKQNLVTLPDRPARIRLDAAPFSARTRWR